MKSIKDIISFAAFMVGIMVICFFAGAASYNFKVFPYPLLRDSFEASMAFKHRYSLAVKHMLTKEKFKLFDVLWVPKKNDEQGTVSYKKDKANDGLTFFAGPDESAYLIDMDGKILHKWHKPFYEIWPNPPQIVTQGPEETIYWHTAKLFPNGDIIAVYQGINQLPYGGGIARLDKDSKVVWKADIAAHHDFDIADNGNIYILSNTLREPAGAEPYVDDNIEILTPDGKSIKKVSVLDSIKASDFKWILPAEVQGDVLHTNNIEILTPELAKSFPMFNAGDLLIAFRELSIIMVMDGKTFSPVWALYGMTQFQHDPDFLPNGNILVLDNRGAVGPGGISQLLEIAPSTMKVKWRYRGTAEHPFETFVRGTQQVLPNGNILVTESNAGTLFEITPSGETVWRYRSPFIDHNSRGLLCEAARLDPGTLTFLKEPAK